MPERWLPVVGYEDLYAISDHGRVRSLGRTVTTKAGWQKTVPARILRPFVTADRYHEFHLYSSVGRRLARVHTLMLEAFIGPRPVGQVACHNDGDGSNNHLDNLRWDTYGENNLDLVRHGVHRQAAKTRCPQGHRYTSANTYIQPQGGRKCRICMRAAKNRCMARKRVN